MKKLALCAVILPALAAGFTACDNNDNLAEVPGGAMVADRFSVEIDSTFELTARSVVNSRVQSRTTTQLLGAINAPTYGTLSADFAAQLFPSNLIDTADVTPERIDSIKLQMVFEKNGFVGDSLVPIGFNVYRLKEKLPYPIYSDTPIEGMYEPEPWSSGMFTAVGISVNDTVAAHPYRYAYANLPREFGVEIFNKFKANPLLFNDPEAFADYFPGIYVKNVYGSGRVTRITNTRIVMYYHKIRRLTNNKGEEVDSLTKHYAYYMSTAPEVVSNTGIFLRMSEKIDRMAAEGEAVVLSPAGRDVEVTFPIESIIGKYQANIGTSLSVINTLTFSLPADSIANGRGINPPTHLLMVLSKEKDEFIAQNKLPNQKTSFLGTFDSRTMTYEFPDMRQYMVDMLAKEEVTEGDYTFTLTPVSLVTETTGSSYYGNTTQTISGISPMIALPSMVNLLPEKAKIKLTFSKQQL